MTEPEPIDVGVYEIPPQHLSDTARQELGAAAAGIPIAPPLSICDFCSAAPPSWVYPALAMGVMGVTSDAAVIELISEDSDPDWAACAICAVGIEANDLNQIAERCRRVTPMYLQTRRIAGERVAEEAVLGPAEAMWKAFLRSRTGPRRHV